MFKKIMMAGFALALALSLSACMSPSEKAAEKVGESMAERALENATGGKADVDVDGENVSIKTDEGSFEAGENVKLPDDFPSDVHVYDGSIIGLIQTGENRGFTLTIQTADPVATVKAVYEEKLREAGWESAGSMDFGSTVSLNSEKDGRSLSVVIDANSDDGMTMVVLGLSQNN